jgi:hypothetical protein
MPKFVKCMIYAGSGLVVGGAALMACLVMPSNLSAVAKTAVALLALSVSAFAVLTAAAIQAQPAKAVRYRQLALVCWGIGATALLAAALAVGRRLP